MWNASSMPFPSLTLRWGSRTVGRPSPVQSSEIPPRWVLTSNYVAVVQSPKVGPRRKFSPSLQHKRIIYLRRRRLRLPAVGALVRKKYPPPSPVPHPTHTSNGATALGRVGRGEKAQKLLLPAGLPPSYDVASIILEVLRRRRRVGWRQRRERRRMDTQRRRRWWWEEKRITFIMSWG